MLLDKLLNVGTRGGAGTAAIGRFQLEAIVAGWVMAGRNHHPGRGLLFHNGIADGRRGRIRPREPCKDAIARHDPRHLGRIPIRQKAGIVPHHQTGVGRVLG